MIFLLHKYGFNTSSSYLVWIDIILMKKVSSSASYSEFRKKNPNVKDPGIKDIGIS